MSYKVHNVRFYGLDGKAAGHCVAYSQSRKLLAVSRADNSIEIWDMRGWPLLVRCIPREATEGSVEALAWASTVHEPDNDDEEVQPSKTTSSKRRKPLEDRRLFSTGLHGLVIEHDLDHLDADCRRQQRQRVWAVTSGPAWCMKFNRATGKLAVGTEEGFVCLYDVVEDGLSYDKVLDKQEGRVLCLDWHAGGDRIVTGSTDTLRLWDVRSGHPLTRMSTGRTEKNVETVVWSVALLNNMTVVSGDSRGKTCFWNGKTGTLMDGYQTHRGDVLTVAVNAKENEVCSSGVDPVVFHFNPVQSGGEGRLNKWVKSVHRFSHTHDVRALLWIDHRVISVGVDANLTVFDLRSKSLTRYPPIPHGRNAVVSPGARTLSLRYPDAVQIWKLGEALPPASDAQKTLSLVRDPVKLVEVQASAGSTVAHVDVSVDGTRLAYTTTEGKISVFKLELEAEGRPGVEKVPFRPAQSFASRFNHVKFLAMPDRLLASTVGGTLACFDVETGDVAWSLDSRQLGLQSGIRSLAVRGNDCLVLDFAHQLVLLDASDAEKPVQRLPGHASASVAAAALDPHSDGVVVVYSNHHLMEYSPRKRSVTPFSQLAAGGKKTFPLPEAFLTKKFATSDILFPDKDTLMLYDAETICSIDKSKAIKSDQARRDARPPSAKKTKGKPEDGWSADAPVGEPLMKVTKKYQHLIFLGSLGDHELVAVEDKPQNLEARLPPGLRQKKFGAM